MIEDILERKYGEYLEGLDIYENKDSLVLSRIVIKDEFKGEGIGTKVMIDLVSYADQNKQIVALTPSADFGGNKNRLTQFYKRFGFKHNKGVHKSYEFRDTMIRNPNLNEGMEQFKGGLADGMTAKDLAEKHDVPVKDITTQLNKGMKVEMEHTNDDNKSKEIAMDHLFEDPKYYDKLEKVEETIQREFIKKLVRENIDLSLTDETPDTMSFDIYYNKRKAGNITCGPAAEGLGEDTKEIVRLYLEDEYTNLNVANQAVKSLWKAKPDINRFVVRLPNQSHLFWEKLGFQRLNDTFHMLMRGH